jgi:FAD/FMN-containing dehydrogenase
MSKSVEEEGFLRAWERHLPDIVRAWTERDAAGTFGPEAPRSIDAVLWRWLMKDPAMRAHFEKLSQQQPELLQGFLEGVESVPSKLASQDSHEMFEGLRDLLLMRAEDFDEVREGDGTPMKCVRDLPFFNWGLSVRNAPAITFLPKTKQGVCNLVKWARSHQKRVRLAGYRHTWSDLYSADDHVLVSMLPLDVDTIPTPPPPVDPDDQLQGIQICGTIEDNGVTKALCRIGAKTTNEQFRSWTQREGGGAWTVPLNVIMVEITWGGSNAPICHGAGRRHRTLSDLVAAIEFVNANGELQVVDDPDQLRAAAGCFGLLGVVTSITLKLDPMSYAVMRPEKPRIALAIPPPRGLRVPRGIDMQGITEADMDRAFDDFVHRCENDYYAEWFWFPYRQSCWVNTWRNDGRREQAHPYPHPVQVWIQQVTTFLAHVANGTIFKLLPADWQAELFSSGAMAALPGDKTIVTTLIDALHFRRGIQNMRVRDMELEIPIPPRPDDPNAPDWSVCQKAWWAVLTNLYDRRSRDAHDAPMRIALEMRVTADSNVIMAPQYGNRLGTCSIEVLSSLNVKPEEWLAFKQEIASAWDAYTEPGGARLNVRPHWAKEWQGLTLRGLDMEQYLREVAYRDRIPEFEARLAAIARAGGHTLADVWRTFSNPLLDRILHAPQVSLRSREQVPSVAYVPDYEWTNHGRNLRCIVSRYYEPRSVEEVQQIVVDARRNRKKVRVVGDSHSWSPLSTVDDYMISTRRLNRILAVGTDPPRITVQPGVTVGDTLRAYERHGVVLPMNVDVPPITIAGAVSVGANGFSRRWGTYSEFVHEIELVTGTGEIRVINRERDHELWRAAACSLGLWGVITRITLDLRPMFNVRVVDRKVDMDRVLADFPNVFRAHDYAQLFWFPFNRRVLLQVADVTSAAPTWTEADNLWKELNGWLETGGSHLLQPLLTRFPQTTPLFCQLAFHQLKESDFVMEQSSNVLLGRWIDSMFPSQNVSVSLPPGDDYRMAIHAWSSAVDLIDQMASEGKYPVNLEMNARIFGPCTTLLGSLPGDRGAETFNIQVTSFRNKDWEEFALRMMERWMAIPGARPHWAKQFQNLPDIVPRLRALYGENLARFLQLREREGIDPDAVFVNDFLHDLFFAPEPSGQELLRGAGAAPRAGQVTGTRR